MTNNEPLISIIMSVYNSEKWLQKTIDSILSQTYTNWEFIIVNDASKDGSLEILNEYCKNSKFVIINQTTNIGLVKNLNYALEFCKGKYIARIDADDICIAKRFEKQIEYLEKNTTVDVLAAYVDIIDENDKVVGVWNEDRKYNNKKKIRKILPFINCIAHPSIVIKSEVLKSYRYNELQKNAEDWDLWLQLEADGKDIDKIQEPLVLYRVHQNSVTVISRKQSVFVKNHYSYKQYLKLALKNKKLNFYNAKVLFAFFLNYVKLILSKFKRIIYP